MIESEDAVHTMATELAIKHGDQVFVVARHHFFRDCRGVFSAFTRPLTRPYDKAHCVTIWPCQVDDALSNLFLSYHIVLHFRGCHAGTAWDQGRHAAHHRCGSVAKRIVLSVLFLVPLNGHWLSVVLDQFRDFLYDPH